MSITSVTQGVRPPSLHETLATSLQGKGLSAEKSSTIGTELESVARSTMSAGSGPADPASVRAAIEAKLSSDVEAGTLTGEEADQVRAALDEFESQMAANRPAGPPPGGPGGPGGAGGPPPGGGGTEEAEETEEEDETEKTALEQLLEKLKEAGQGNDTAKTRDYLTQLMSQGLVDIKA